MARCLQLGHNLGKDEAECLMPYLHYILHQLFKESEIINNKIILHWDSARVGRSVRLELSQHLLVEFLLAS